MALEDELEAISGPRQVVRDPELRAPYETDWTRRFSGTARCVVRPGSTDEVVAVLVACAEHGASVVPQGGNTGLVGGGVPRSGEVVLSLARLDAVAAVEPTLAQVEAGAGATLVALQARAREAGLDAGLDFAARDIATVGGVVACDAGGARALRHGTARARVAGLEAVLGDGRVVSGMSGLLKDNAGYDLGALLVGSEGTLGVITRVRWRLVPRLASRVSALVPLASVSEAAELLGVLRRDLPSLEAADFFLHGGLELVLEHLKLPSPVSEPAPIYLLLECADRTDPTEALAEVLGDREALVATDTGERERLWRLREAHTEAISARGVPHKLDVGIPQDRLGEFLEQVPQAVRRACSGAETILFGHLGDGNVHVNVLGAPADDPRVDDAVLALVIDLGGTISAEHGVGTAKAGWLERARGHDEFAAMHAVKRALDPHGVLNPGAVLASPPGASRAEPE